MDLTHVFIMGIIVAVVAWILTLVTRENIKALFGTIGIAFIFIPILYITFSGLLEIQSVSSNTTAMSEIANTTTTKLIDYIAENLPEILVSDLAGTLVGFVAGQSTRRYA